MDQAALSEQDHPVLIEFSERSGEVRRVSLSAGEAIQRSGQALHGAMSLIQEMARHVRETVGTMADRPSATQVTFGIKFDAEAGAFVAKAGTGASIVVTLSWDAETTT